MLRFALPCGHGPQPHGQCGKAAGARQPLPVGHRALAAQEVLPGKDEVVPAVPADLLLPGRGLPGTVPSPPTPSKEYPVCYSPKARVCAYLWARGLLLVFWAFSLALLWAAGVILMSQFHIRQRMVQASVGGAGGMGYCLVSSMST